MDADVLFHGILQSYLAARLYKFQPFWAGEVFLMMLGRAPVLKTMVHEICIASNEIEGY